VWCICHNVSRQCLRIMMTTWTAASDVDIDHLVPLSNAWKVSLDHLAGWTARVWTTSVPSRSRTVSRVVHLSQREPPMPQNHDDFYSFLGGALPTPSPPGVPSASTATSELEGLTVAAQGSLVAPQLELWTTSVPSRSRTVSRVVHLSQREPPIYLPHHHLGSRRPLLQRVS
jgi:hypothetical protein